MFCSEGDEIPWKSPSTQIDERGTSDTCESRELMVTIFSDECMSSFFPDSSLMHFMFSFSLEKVLEAITTAGEWRAIERFSPIVQGLRDRSVQLQVSAE